MHAPDWIQSPRPFLREFDDFDEHLSEAKVKEAGKLKTEGKDYTVCDGDIIHFRFNN